MALLAISRMVGCGIDDGDGTVYRSSKESNVLHGRVNLRCWYRGGEVLVAFSAGDQRRASDRATAKRRRRTASRPQHL